MGKVFKDALKEARNISVDNEYYAKNYEDNIYLPPMGENHIRMFCKGGGKELLPKEGKKEKGACIYSSSMLAYNFFSWINKENPLVMDDINYDIVVFEEQFRVLRNRNNKANLDVVLVSDDRKTLLLLESKFTEHLATTNYMSEISTAYDSEESYFKNCLGNRWVSIIKEIRKMPDGKEEYYDGLKQVVCHLIGISSVIRNKDARDWFNHNSWLHHVEGLTLKGDETFIFKSIVFHPNTENESKVSKAYELLNKKFVNSIDFLPDNLKVGPEPIITYRQLWDSGMNKSIRDDSLRKYLEKYLKVHNNQY